MTKAEAVLNYSDGTRSEKVVLTITDMTDYAPFAFSWDDNGKMVESVDVTILEAIKSNGEAATTVNRKLSTLRTFYKFLTARGIVEQTPVKNITRAGNERKKL